MSMKLNHVSIHTIKIITVLFVATKSEVPSISTLNKILGTPHFLSLIINNDPNVHT